MKRRINAGGDPEAGLAGQPAPSASSCCCEKMPAGDIGLPGREQDRVGDILRIAASTTDGLATPRRFTRRV